MKRTLIFLLVLSGFFISCSKDNPAPAAMNKIIRVEFSSDTLSMYSFATRLDTVAAFDSALATTFQKNYLFPNLPTATGDTLTFTVYPPFNWVGTSAQAMVNLKLFIDDVERATNSGTLSGFDRPGGVTVFTVL
jgi:hypothetical protein